MTLIGAMFGVTVQLLVTTVPPIALDNTTPASLDAPIGDTLRIDWQVTKKIGSSADECTIQIYNLSLPNRVALSEAKRTGRGWPKSVVTRVQLDIGWGGIPEPLFLGEVVHFEAGRQVGPDVVTTITALTGGVARFVPPAGGSSFGLAASALLITEAARMGYFVSPSMLALVESRSAAKAITAWSKPGDQEPQVLLDWLFATLDLTWGVDTFNNIVAFENGVRLDVPMVVLGPTTGLLNATPANDGIDFEGLAQPKVVPGGQLQFLEVGQFGIERPSGPPMRCETISFAGSSYGQSVMRGTARPIEVLS